MTTSLQSIPGALSPDAVDESIEEQQRIVSKVIRKIMPLALIGIFVSYVDRTNLSVAGPDMQAALGLTPAMFGLASGLFFIGYVLFEIPSNIALQRYGAKLWIARIMVTWGLICMGTSLVTGATSLYIFRLLLGIGEAGFYPGILFYLSLFVPIRYLTRAFAVFQIGIPISLALGSALTAALLTMDGILGISGWQWVLIIEGALAVVVGIITCFAMASTPEKARWLTAREKQTLIAAIRSDRNSEADDSHGLSAIASVMKTRAAWYYCFQYTSMLIGFYAVTYWLPQIIKLRFSVSAVQAGLLSAVPWVFCAIGLFTLSRIPPREKNRAGVLSAILMLAAVGLTMSAFAQSAILAFAGLCMAACMQAAVPLFYSFPSQHFAGARAAVALALVNSVGNIGGFFGPYILGVFRQTFHTDTVGLVFLAGTFVIAACMALGLPRQLRSAEAQAGARA